MFFDSYLFLIMFFIGLFSFIFFRFHYLMLLLSIEIMMLSMFFNLSFFGFLGFGGLELVIQYLLLMVCGAGFGICMVIFFARVDGNEMFTYY